MIPLSNAARAQRRMEIAAKRLGSTVTLKWTEWPDGKPAVDPTTGAAIETVDQQPVQKTSTANCFVHFIAPGQHVVRQHAEIETGDVILDALPQLKRITDAGTTELVVDSVVTVYALNAANREASEAATADDVTLDSLEELSFDVDGVRYVQKQVGERLAKSWDAIVAGFKFSRPLLLRKAT